MNDISDSPRDGTADETEMEFVLDSGSPSDDGMHERGRAKSSGSRKTGGCAGGNVGEEGRGVEPVYLGYVGCAD